ncbi:4Fe-4S binding protein [Massilia sp. 9I]|uniref:4Fe-4S binding protein n=1 Tax=Massilia sp. 9I TaxID=2653152 RepID=UPI0012F46A9B|nr:4Fe-4S binding protein [Massilia sp. 9I]VXB55958.1 Regulator of nitric oxide reductase transcription [Massilia sp. 9I]
MRALRLLVLLLLLAAGAAGAGTLTKQELARRFPAPLMVGDKASEVPAWPLFKQNATATELVGYVFESVDLAPVPGFTGVPPNLLVAIDPKGTFIDVAVLSQHEPVFLDGLGEEPLRQFVGQYKGVSLGQNIDVGGQAGAERVRLDGVSKATASVRIVNQSVLSAALKVARAKLGFAQGRDPGNIAHIRNDVYEPMSLRALRDAGLIKHVRITNREAERLFAGSAGVGLDPEALARPDDTFIDLFLAWGSVPTVGRNLLDEKSWRRMTGRLEAGDHALLVMSAGRHGILAEDFVRGSVPQRIALRQDGLPLEMRDLNLELSLREPLPVTEIVALRVIAQAGLDPSRPLDFSLPLTRSKGIVYPERITRELPLRYALPERLYSRPEPETPAWHASWRNRAPQLAVLGFALALLTVALAMPRRLARNGRRFAWARRIWLLFTIGFIGYYAQAQLSIVNLTGVLQALREGRGLGFLLYDPMSLALWGFVLVSLLLWGRGTFCGWLCPFGAMQELTGQLGRALRLPQILVRRRVDRWLRRIKYVVLAAIAAAALLYPALADRLVEVEPFKTAVTLGFVRSWPYVAWAVGLLALSVVLYKFFCRYLCPFGAALALLGRVRRLDWIARRTECGTPCQTCRHRCAYNAIAPSGKVEYDECFQCLDCVVIYESDALCAPRILERKRARTVPIVPVTGA